MADMNPMSNKLKEFESTVLPQIPAMQSKAQDISNTINEAMNGYNSALNGMTSGVKEDMGEALNSCMALVIDASERLKSSMTTDMLKILSECENVRPIIEEIKQIIEQGTSWKWGVWENIWDEIGKFITGRHWVENDTTRIKDGNAKIDNLNREGEAMLTAIANSANSISLGIVGNMTHGGALGTWTNFDSTYSFTREAWQAANPIAPPATFFDVIGCFAVGQVEGVVGFVESIVDFGLTPVAWAASALGWDVLKDFIETDWSRKVGDAAIDLLGIQNVEWSRTVGSLVGFGSGVNSAVKVIQGLGKGFKALKVVRAVTSVASAGQAVENRLQSGASMGQAALSGTVWGGVTYGVTGALEKVAGAFANSKIGGKVVSSVKNAASKIAGNKVVQAVAKPASVVSKVATAPARWTSKLLIEKNPAASLLAKGVVNAGSFLGRKVASGKAALGNRFGRTKGQGTGQASQQGQGQQVQGQQSQRQQTQGQQAQSQQSQRQQTQGQQAQSQQSQRQQTQGQQAQSQQSQRQQTQSQQAQSQQSQRQQTQGQQAQGQQSQGQQAQGQQSRGQQGQTKQYEPWGDAKPQGPDDSVFNNM